MEETDQISKRWEHLLIERGAFWCHDGNPQRPHALLTTGKHSNGFVMGKEVYNDDNLRMLAVSDLLDLLIREKNFDINEIELVVGPATGATKLAQSLAQEITHSRVSQYPPCAWASPVKDDSGETRKMIFSDKEKLFLPGKKTLRIEDVLTTGASVELATESVYELGGICLPFVCTLVNRSGMTSIGGAKIIALLHKNLPIWEPALCPLCEKGSEAISPKRPPTNWQLLNASY